MYKDLSDRQLQILNFIKSQVEIKGYPPSVREICKGVNLKSTSTVHGHLEALEERGYIRKDPTKPRAIEITDKNYLNSKQDIVSVPVVGCVTAGKPILAVENIESTFPISKEFTQDADIFMLKVQGDSMIDAGIYSGDYILVKQQNYANNGDIVVALIDEEATVKRFFKEENYIRLQPENSSMGPIYTDNVLILGLVIGLYRQF
ncbi:MAG TPA: transcriptional repressor LexA [Tissierellales bacterium]|nr:transcriptional repressor LexA [Tissierellales bacterium]